MKLQATVHMEWEGGNKKSKRFFKKGDRRTGSSCTCSENEVLGRKETIPFFSFPIYSHPRKGFILHTKSAKWNERNEIKKQYEILFPPSALLSWKKWKGNEREKKIVFLFFCSSESFSPSRSTLYSVVAPLSLSHFSGLSTGLKIPFPFLLDVDVAAEVSFLPFLLCRCHPYCTYTLPLHTHTHTHTTHGRKMKALPDRLWR